MVQQVIEAPGTPEEPAVSSPEQEELNTSGGDADPTVSTDAAEVKPNAPSEADLTKEAEAAYKADLEGKEGEQKAPEPERRPAVDPALVAQARNTLSNNHRARQEKIDAYDSELEDIGVEKALRTRLVKELKDFLTEEHADGLRLAGYEAAETTKVREQGAVYNSLLAHVPKAQETAFLAELEEQLQPQADAQIRCAGGDGVFDRLRQLPAAQLVHGHIKRAHAGHDELLCACDILGLVADAH